MSRRTACKPDRWYWFRFRARRRRRARPTAPARLPAPAREPDRLRFAFASCQHYETGLYTAYEHMIKDDLDLILHLGDYIYEDGGKEGRVRLHVGQEIESLDDYRIRLCPIQVRPAAPGGPRPLPLDGDLGRPRSRQQLRRGRLGHQGVDSLALLARRANAYQAYYESMPLRRRSLPTGPRMRLYRKAAPSDDSPSC